MSAACAEKKLVGRQVPEDCLVLAVEVVVRRGRDAATEVAAVGVAPAALAPSFSHTSVRSQPDFVCVSRVTHTEHGGNVH